MIRSRLAAAAAAALVLAACGSDDDAQPGAAPADAPAAAAAPAPAPAEPAPPSGMAGAPGVARRGVDSANAAYQRQEDEVNRMSQPASGTTP